MKTIKTILALAVVALLTAFMINPDKGGYKVGDVASDFSLKNVDGKLVSMSDYTRAKGIILVFTCNTCPYSVANEDRLIALNNKYKIKGFPVVAVNPNDPAAQRGEDRAAMKKRSDDKGFTFPYLLDEGQKVYPKYGATRTPHVFVLSKQSKGLVVEYIGAIDDSSRDESKVKKKYVEDVVDALLAGKKPKKTVTKAIGCSIKTLR